MTIRRRNAIWQGQPAKGERKDLETGWAVKTGYQRLPDGSGRQLPAIVIAVFESANLLAIDRRGGSSGARLSPMQSAKAARWCAGDQLQPSGQRLGRHTVPIGGQRGVAFGFQADFADLRQGAAGAGLCRRTLPTATPARSTVRAHVEHVFTHQIDSTLPVNRRVSRLPEAPSIAVDGRQGSARNGGARTRAPISIDVNSLPDPGISISTGPWRADEHLGHPCKHHLKASSNPNEVVRPYDARRRGCSNILDGEETAMTTQTVRTTGSLILGAVVAGAVALVTSTASAQDYVTDEMLLEAAQDPNNWLMAPRDYSGTRYSPLSQINTKSVKRLVPKWTFSFGVLDAQNTTPLVNNGVMYATASHGRTFAINARTGDEIWRYYDEIPEGVAGNMCCDIGNRGVALYGDKVFVATPDADVVALDSKTGEVVWHTNIGNWEEAYTMTVAPLVVKGNVIVGMSGAEYPTRLYIEALDSETGEQAWRRYTIPAPGEPNHDSWGSADAAAYGGASAWITGAYDPELDTLYWGVGNPKPRLGRRQPPGRQPVTPTPRSPLIPQPARSSTGTSTPRHDIWDYDGNNEPVLMDVDGRQLYFHGDRNGLLYAIDRTDSSFVWGVPISKVNWMTGFTPEGRPIVNPEKAPRYDYEAKDICPASEGGKWWNPMAVNPHTKMIFVAQPRDLCGHQERPAR